MLYRHRDDAAVRHAFRVACGPRFHGAGRAADPGAGEAGGAHRRGRRAPSGPLLGRLFQQHLLGGEAGAHRDRAGRAVDLHGRRGAASSRRTLFGDLSRTRLLLVGVGEMVELAATYFVAQRPRRSWSPTARSRAARNSPSASAAEAIALAELPARLARVRHRRHRHRLDAADPRQGPGRARAQGAPAPPDVHRRFRRAARRRGRGRRRSRTSSSTPSTTWATIVQRGRASARRAAVAEAEAIVERQVSDVPRVAGRARRGPRDRRAAPARRRSTARPSSPRRAARLARGEDPARGRSRRSPRASPTSSCTTRRQALSRAAEGEREALARAIETLYPRRSTERDAARAMKPSIAAKLASLDARLKEIDARLSDPGRRRRPRRASASSRRSAPRSTRSSRLFGEYRKAEGDLAAAEEMAKDPADARLRRGRDPRGARRASRRSRPSCRSMLLPRDPNDERNLFLEIRAGTGGDESALFAGDLFRMYTRFAERNRWQVEVVSESRGRRGRLQGGHRAHRRQRRLLAAQVRIRRPPRAARARDRDAGPHPHLGRDGRGDARGRRRVRRGASIPPTCASTPSARAAPAAST